MRVVIRVTLTYLLLLLNVWLARSCKCIPPVLMCLDIGGSLEELKQMCNLNTRRIEAVIVIHGNVRTFDFDFTGGRDRFKNITLTDLNITSFKSNDIFSKLHNLEYLNLSRNFLRQIPSPLPKSLISLDISRNRLQITVDATFKDIRNFFSSVINKDVLTTLNFAHNYLEIADFDILDSRLETLDLSHNPIREIVDGYLRVNVLNLSHTELDLLKLDPEHLKNLRTIRYLDLSYGAYKTLDGDLVEAFAARTAVNNEFRLNLEGNPWSCSCHMKPARRKLRALKGSGFYREWFDAVRCANPPRLFGRRLIDVDENDLVCDVGYPKFKDCCFKVSLEAEETVTAYCGIEGLPLPEVWCEASDDGIRVTAKPLATPSKHNLEITFTGPIGRPAPRVDYKCITRQFKGRSTARGPFSPSLECSFLEAKRKPIPTQIPGASISSNPNLCPFLFYFSVIVYVCFVF